MEGQLSIGVYVYVMICSRGKQDLHSPGFLKKLNELIWKWDLVY